jgi:hypothetical protein
MTLAVQADGEDEPTIVEVPPRTLYQWEKANRGRSASQLAGNAWKLEYLYEIAWLAKGKPGEFAAFCATTDVGFAQVESTSDEDEDSGADPTPSGQSTEPSSTSPA